MSRLLLKSYSITEEAGEPIDAISVVSGFAYIQYGGFGGSHGTSETIIPLGTQKVYNITRTETPVEYATSAESKSVSLTYSGGSIDMDNMQICIEIGVDYSNRSFEFPMNTLGSEQIRSRRHSSGLYINVSMTIQSEFFATPFSASISNPKMWISKEPAGEI